MEFFAAGRDPDMENMNEGVVHPREDLDLRAAERNFQDIYWSTPASRTMSASRVYEDGRVPGRGLSI